MYESLITRFTEDHPCWTESMLRRVGEDAAGLDALAEDGMLVSSGGFYWLSEAGRLAFSKIAAEMFIYERPGAAPDEPAVCALTTGLWLELERCNLQRWGLKRYLFRPGLPVRPKMKRSEVWGIDNRGGVIWLYLDNPDIRGVIEGHVPTASERRVEPASDAFLKWQALPCEAFMPDLIFLANYDFENYLDFKGHPLDELKIINTDRFFFSAARDMDARLDVIGRFHRWILEQRYLRVPGYFDVDTQEQSSVSWLIFFTETQSEALGAQSELMAFGTELIEPANPMEIWTLSLEALRECPPRREVIWDVLPSVGQPVCLTL